MTWTKETVDDLEKLNAAGLYASEIADALGNGITRNSVIGKLNRMGLRAAHKPVPRRPRQKRPPRPRLRIFPPILAPKPKPAEPTPVETALHCTIMELHSRSCRWPIEEIAPRQFLFCGNDTGETYCGYHSRIAYNFTAR